MKPIHIVVPAHNEANHLAPCVNLLRKLYPESSITISTDGNTDNTLEIAYRLANDAKAFVMAYPERMGKGAAIKHALLPDITNAIYDADMAVHPGAIKAMAKWTEYFDGLTVAMRLAEGRSMTRALTSAAYNTATNLLFHTGIYDHQCGCKVLGKKATLIAQKCASDDFFFDTELIIRCQQRGVQVVQYPVAWVEHKQRSTVNVAKDGSQMFQQLIRLRMNAR